MIEEFKLVGFKSHENSKLVFSPHVNVIVGPSDNGKSKIMRGIRFVNSNRPRGDNVITWGKKQALLQLTVKNNGISAGITRTKTKNHSEYILSTADEDIKFSGAEPPEAITKVINLDDINIQKQSEQYFLVFDSPGQVATYIRSITRLDEVDEVVKKLRSQIKSENTQVAIHENNLIEIRAKLAILSDINLDEFEKLLTSAKNIVKVNKDLMREHCELKELLLELEEYEKNEICLPDNIDEILQANDKIVSTYLKEVETELNLALLLAELEEVEEQKITLPDDIIEIIEVDIIIKQYNNSNELQRNLKTLVVELEEIQLDILDFTMEIEQEKKEETELKKQLVNCPACGTELTTDSKAQLLKGT
jgi:exonuclease SbcC